MLLPDFAQNRIERHIPVRYYILKVVRNYNYG
ncbi:hypothetical protein SAMN05444165_1890 [Paraburkholderia phenazinium]|uniref:Uncharacterized protein n=1 Tax=Paraburkholderia phenazinium TaxID=60549 RepID=A0A1N6I7N1_9BURK|nr:hypothetical protein SAMN05444165_1890 [Paraburkholderia phenazinium]